MTLSLGRRHNQFGLSFNSMFPTASWKYYSGFLNLKLSTFQDSLYNSEENPNKISPDFTR